VAERRRLAGQGGVPKARRLGLARLAE
jgi:hypothetical protein